MTSETVGSGAISEPGAAAFVWMGWAALLGGLVAMVGLYAPVVPQGDDFDVVEVVVGRRALGLEWLASAHAGDRPVLPRLVLLALDRVSGHDPRAAVGVSVGLLALAAALAILAARRIRGGTAASDLFLPITLLNPGQAPSLLQAAGLRGALTQALGVGLLTVMAWNPGARLRGGWLVAAVVLAVLLALTSTAGLVAAPFLGAWLVWSGPWSREEEAGPSRGALGLAFLLPWLIAGVLIAEGWGRTSPGIAPDPVALGSRLFQVLALALGRASGGFWQGTGPLVLFLAVIGLVIAGHAARVRAERRARDLGVYLLIGAGLAVAGVLAAQADAGAVALGASRAVVLMTGLAWAIYMSAVLAVRPDRGHALQTGLFLAGCLLLWPNIDQSVREARDRSFQFNVMDRAVAQGMPLSAVVRYNAGLMHPSQEYLAGILPELRRAGFPTYRNLRDDRIERVESVPLEPVRLRNIERTDDGWLTWTRSDPQIDIRLKQAVDVMAVRIRYDLERRGPGGAPTHFIVNWRGSETGWIDPSQVYVDRSAPLGLDRTVTVRVADEVAALRIQPDDQPGRMRIKSIELLLGRQRPRRGGMGGGPGMGRPRMGDSAASGPRLREEAVPAPESPTLRP